MTCDNCKAHAEMVEAAQRFHGTMGKVLHHARKQGSAPVLSDWWEALGEQIDAFINAANLRIDCADARCDCGERVKIAEAPPAGVP